MLLSTISSCFTRKARPLESLVRSTYGHVFPEARSKSSGIISMACRGNSVMANATTQSLVKSSMECVLKSQKRWSTTTPGDHVQLWVLERVIAFALPITLPLAFALEHPVTDGILALLVVMHSHWGIEAIIVDYARPIVVGTVLPKVLHISLYAASAATLAGLLMLIYNGPGLARVCKDFWAIDKKSESEAA